MIVKALNKYMADLVMKDIAEKVLGITYQQLYSKMRIHKIRKHKQFIYKYR